MSHSSGVIAAAGVVTGDADLIDEFTVTIEAWTSGKSTYYGFNSAVSKGAISPTSIDLKDGSARTAEEVVFGGNILTIELTDSPTITNSDAAAFTRFKVGSTFFARSSASYSSGKWSWIGVASNPLGTSGDVDCELRSD